MCKNVVFEFKYYQGLPSVVKPGQPNQILANATQVHSESLILDSLCVHLAPPTDHGGSINRYCSPCETHVGHRNFFPLIDESDNRYRDYEGIYQVRHYTGVQQYLHIITLACFPAFTPAFVNRSRRNQKENDAEGVQ